MNRRVIWSAVAAVAAIVLATLWFLDNFERVPEKVHENMKAEALRHPYLAAERLFSRLGRHVAGVRSPAALDAVAARDGGGVLILEGHRQRTVDRARAARLFAWVERGGYLIVEAERAGEDFLLQRLGVTWVKAAPPRVEGGGAPRALSGEEVVEVALPDGGVRYRLAVRGRGLSSGAVPPVWRASGRDGDVILHFAVGRGQITVVQRLGFFDNFNLGAHDHAELAWALLQRYQPGGDVHLAVRLAHPTLWQWLWNDAWMTLAGGALLVAVWLWTVVPRFGGTRAAAGTTRRDLAQHLLAVGRSLWREGGLGHLRAVVRREIAQRLALRHPSLARRLSGERHAGLAQMSGVDVLDIKTALADERLPSPETFTQAMQTLQRLERKL